MATAHVLCPHGRRVDTHEDGGSGDGADRRVRVGGGEARTAGGQGIEVRRLSVVISVAAQPVGRIILAYDPENVGPVCCEGESWEKENE